jgi:hypothetical protein
MRFATPALFLVASALLAASVVVPALASEGIRSEPSEQS